MKRWPLKLKIKNGLDGTTPGTFKASSIWPRFLEVVRLTPNTRHWLPTQERQFLPDPKEVPENLVIRLSRSKIDGPSSSAWSHESGVTTSDNRTCPAPDQGGKCKAAVSAGTKEFKLWYMVNTKQNLTLQQKRFRAAVEA